MMSQTLYKDDQARAPRGLRDGRRWRQPRCSSSAIRPRRGRARSRSLQDEPAAEPLAPAQQDQLFPAQRGGGVSLAQATSMAQSRVPGRVVRAETVQMGDRVVHEIRILGEDGRTVRTVRIDAQTGAFL